MLQFAASDNMLVDYFTKEQSGNFELHVPRGQCAYLQLSDGREGFFESGDHRIRLERSSALFRRFETVSMYWFNLSDHIELHLSNSVQVMEQMLKSVDPELRLFAPVDVEISMDVTVRIEDREKLLQLLLDRQEEDGDPVLNKEWLTEYLEEKLQYILEESLNNGKQRTGISICKLSHLSEDVECALIGELCDLLESVSLELVAARISRIRPTQEGLEHFQRKEAETLSWYNQVQMDKFSRRKSRHL
ncbi:MAG: hypothetical protein Q4B03_04635 [Lachnospiraceae bacterium]|nr:hypothetical protein [Lachnospiraceae bacterium]